MEKLESDEFEVIVGTYEEFVLGYRLKGVAEGGKGKKKGVKGLKQFKLEPSFTNHSHSGSIRSVCAVGKFLASGSADEAIRLINMNARIEHGYMQEQTGTITCLTNFGSRYLFSGCNDGTICIWKSGSWICEKTLQAHKGGVVDISVHPSGKLALSIGMDKSLKTWNLIKGRTGYVTNLHAVGDIVRWSPEGTYYAVGVANRLDVYSVETAKVTYSVPFGKRISCVCFPTDDIVIFGGDKESIEIHDIKSGTKLSETNVHQTRVKDMRYIKEYDLLVTGSNCDQKIKLWSFRNGEFSHAPELLTEFDTTCRITCLTVWSKGIVSSHQELSNADQEEESIKEEDPVEDDDDGLSDENEDEIIDEDEDQLPEEDDTSTQDLKKTSKKKREVIVSKADSKVLKRKTDAPKEAATKRKKKRVKS